MIQKNKMKLLAFTLSEAIISLTIIGVIAALTVPNLISHYQEQVTITKVNKFYKTMNDAFEMAKVRRGPVTRWHISNNETLFRPLLDNLKIAKDCGDALGQNCVATMTYLLNGVAHRNYDTHPTPYYKVTLEDGSNIWMRWNEDALCRNRNETEPEVCGIIWYDVNGPKKPNTVGKDTFLLFIKKNQIIPHTSDDCRRDEPGWGCSRYIIQNGNMKYLH